MVSISEIAEGVYQLQPELKRPLVCTVYLIADDKTALIETGPTSQGPDIVQAVEKLGVVPVSYIIPTHVHVDHSGGAGYLARQWPQAQVLIHQRGVQHLIDPSKVISSSKQAFGDDFEQKTGPILPVPESQVQGLEDGQTIDLGQRQLKAIDTPGHASHHMCIYDCKTRGLFTGDALGLYFYVAGQELILPVLRPGTRLDPLLESIAKMKQISPDILLFSHHGASRDVTRLTQMAEDAARALAGIGQAMAAVQSSEQIARSLRGLLLGSLAVEVKPEVDLTISMTIDGYIDYFRGSI